MYKNTKLIDSKKAGTYISFYSILVWMRVLGGKMNSFVKRRRKKIGLLQVVAGYCCCRQESGNREREREHLMALQGSEYGAWCR